MKNQNIKFLIIVIIIIITVLIALICFLHIQRNNQNTVDINDIENDISYIQGPLKQEIENLEYNSIEYVHVTNQQMAEKYFTNYKQLMINNLEQAYKLLEKEYQTKRFSTYEIYNEYIQNNISYIKQAVPENISIRDYDDYKEYTCKDQYGNIYIFKETAVMEYTVQLDDYILENEVFGEKYAEVNGRDKAILNINKFFEMLNMQDYASAYGVLDESFKQNYFPTQQQFEEYMKGKLFRYNHVTYNSYSEPVADLYSFNLTISDKAKQVQATIDFNIIMQLQEGTDFVMSFEVS